MINNDHKPALVLKDKLGVSNSHKDGKKINLPYIALIISNFKQVILQLMRILCVNIHILAYGLRRSFLYYTLILSMNNEQEAIFHKRITI